MPNIGPMELIIVLIIALVILGPKRLPSAGRSLGQGLREFRDGIAGRGDARSRDPGASGPRPRPTRQSPSYQTASSREPAASGRAHSAVASAAQPATGAPVPPMLF